MGQCRIPGDGPGKPKHHAAFALEYEKRLLEPFGLKGYGCCEDLTGKLDLVFDIPQIRRISISPWADVDIFTERLAGNYVFSWKPNPAHLVGGFDEAEVAAYVRHTVEVAQSHRRVLEMVLKDTHTCERQTDRFDRWTQLARKVIEETAGEPPARTCGENENGTDRQS